MIKQVRGKWYLRRVLRALRGSGHVEVSGRTAPLWSDQSRAAPGVINQLD